MDSTAIPHPRELMPKPSDAIDAMINGLKIAADESEFAIDMCTYGEMLNNVCVGCAATFAALAAARKAGMEFIPDADDRWMKLGSEWETFEVDINSLRAGEPGWLLRHYGLQLNLTPWAADELRPAVKLPFLNTKNWRDNLGPYEAYRDQLRALGH